MLIPHRDFTIIQYSAVGFLFSLYIIQGIKVFHDDKVRSKKKKERSESRAMSRAMSRAASKAGGKNPHYSGEVDYYGQPIKKEKDSNQQLSPTKKESEAERMARITIENTHKNSLMVKTRNPSITSITSEERETLLENNVWEAKAK